MTVPRRHPDVHARTRCVISDCLSWFCGWVRGLLGGLDGEGKVGARLSCTGIGGAPENAFEQLQRPVEAHRVCVSTRAIYRVVLRIDFRGSFLLAYSLTVVALLLLL